MYDENYYKTLNYADYLGRQERYDKLALELTTLLKQLNLIEPKSEVIDYGCAVGFLLKSFSDLGYTNCTGWDISEWARNEASKRASGVLCRLPRERQFKDLMLCLDVLEHMEDEDIRLLFKKYYCPTALIVRIPCSMDGGKSFHLDVSKRDPTHINCKTAQGWIDKLMYEGNFSSVFNLNLLTIYDSPGVFCAMFVK